MTDNKKIGVAVIADCTAYDVYSYRPVIVVEYSRGQHEYFPTYSFKLKSAFDDCQLFSRSLRFAAKRYIVQQKCMKQRPGRPAMNTTVQLLIPLHRR